MTSTSLPANISETDKKALQIELARFLSNGLFGIGKTAASATVTTSHCFDPPPPKTIDINRLQTGQTIIITLQSLSKLLPDKLQTDATNDGKTLRACYQDKFTKYGLELKTFFAEQQFIGGYYWHKRYNKNKPYNPQILTKAGSVFRFIVTDANRAQEALTDWQIYGIPSDDENWQSNPYNRNNGYGEIAINLPIHWALEPNHASANWESIE